VVYDSYKGKCESYTATTTGEMKVALPQRIVVDLYSFRRPGSTAVLTRMYIGDKRKIDLAARHLGLAQADFTRMVLIQAAEQILAEAEEPEVPKPKVSPMTVPGKRVKLSEV